MEYSKNEFSWMTSYSDQILNSARSGNLMELSLMIKKGYDVNVGDSDMIRPIHESSAQGHIECVQLLLEHGAKVNIRNIDGATPLCEAAARGHLDCLQLLLKNGAWVNPALLLSTPIHEAVINDQWKCCECLANAGANLEASDCHYGTPLHVAASHGHINCARVLLCSGSCVNAIMRHSTALHEVAKTGNTDFIYLLLEHGADIWVKNNQGDRPVDLVPNECYSAREALLAWEKTVPSLMHICRINIRKQTGHKLKILESLPLPKLLRDYLTHAC